jgi:hypothetical protein
MPINPQEEVLLAAFAPDTKINWSDSWSDADMQEFTAASLGRFEAEEQEALGETR